MSATDLQQLFDGDLGPLDGVSYDVFHLVPFQSTDEDRYGVQVDGHIGLVETFDINEFDGPLELVEELNRLAHLHTEHEINGDDEDLVVWAGKMMTSSKAKAEQNPELYQYVPEDVPPVEEEIVED